MKSWVGALAMLLVAGGCASTSEPRVTPEAGTGDAPAVSAGAPEPAKQVRSVRPATTSPADRRGREARNAPAVGRVVGAPRGGPIRLGYTITDTTGVAAATGSSDSSLQDSNADENTAAARRDMEALVKWANSTGGVGGRKIVPFGFVLSTTDGANVDKMQENCVAAAQDKKVSVYIDHALYKIPGEQGWSCFAKHRVTFIGPVSQTDRAWLKTVRPYIATTNAALDRSLVGLVDGLSRAGYFKGATVGVILPDVPTVVRVYRQKMVPALRAIGVKVADVSRLHPTDQGTMTAQAASTVLRFKSAGIDHVIPIIGSFNYLTWNSQAESQAYYPRYGFGDYGEVAGLASFYGAPTQNRNAIAVSSSEGVIIEKADEGARNFSDDVDRNDPSLSKGLKRCLDVLSKATGKDYYKGNSGRSVAFPYYCDHFFLWLESARKLGSRSTPQLFGRGLEALGASYLPVNVHSTTYSPGRFDGASTYRIGRFSENAACRCFVAISGWRALKY